MRCVRIFCVWLLVLSGLVSAGTVIYVDAVNGSDGWPGTAGQPKQSIGAAISAAVDTDEIVVRAGTYTGANNRNLQPGSKNIIIRSESGPAATIIDAQGQGRIFYLIASPTTARIEGFTIRNGYNNQAAPSGGGGALYMHASSCTIEDCILEDNTGLTGGAMMIRNSSATIRNCVIRNNVLSHTTYAVKGGGVHLFDNTDLKFESCVFSGNKVLDGGYNGGAISKDRGVDSFDHCVFEGNYSRINAGVLYIERGDSVFTNCVFYGNSAGVRASCFYIVYPMQVPSTSVTVRNSIFWGNTATTSQLAKVLSGSLTDGVLNYSYCDINPSHIDADGIVNATGENFHANPLFASAGYDDGSQWVQGDYHLKSMVGRYDPSVKMWVVDTSHSPCIDAGDPAEPYGNEPTSNGERLNIGIYGNTWQASKSEYCSTPIPADLSGDCRVDFEDFAMFAEAWLTCNLVPAEFCW